MSYNYENLDPERFQLFCQSLLNSEFPKTQSFPIGQPDGGRDAVVYTRRRFLQNEFNVFQVKFVRKNDKDILKWLEDTLKGERRKINHLIRRGAKEYFLLTNLSGTAHLDSGTIDKVNSILEKYIPIPTYCWWREDLNSKLNVNWDLKWVFPELFSSADLFRIIVESRLNNEDKERRFNAIRLYVSDQYDTDSKVKFKQVELQNQLFDLFIDVPISPKRFQGHEYRNNQSYYQLLSTNPDIKYYSDKGYDVPTRPVSFLTDEESFLGASTFFLNDNVQEKSMPIVLEGGPGQGKSTITQYVCQIHRIRLLNHENEFEKVPAHHLKSSIRLPIKIDLRDFASWINNINPFKISSDNQSANIRSKSLDSFIAAHIEYYSGVKFDVNDLHEILKISKLLLVLDGFDEVADINLREEIVEVITKGIKRINTFCEDVQAIITSRPAAFLNSPTFSKEEYEHYFLVSVNSILIDIYSDKWIKAKQLPQKEGFETKKILKEKLTQPHIKDLAKNPMQLAILISLIHTKGYSLPDKRTAFYDSYIEVFFNRESEKDATVRKYRDLIIELHQYTAWIIHREAELGSNGRIRQNDLVKLLEEYLEAEEHDISIASRLFDKMAERVVALVSRIEGTFEFEVQPLREYFCAKFLYSTAPYSPAGNERKGTKPDRFDAMAKNFYWLNVLRFYSGCFDKGELPAIIDRLIELTEEEDYKFISHPRELSAILLSDWVFAQYPRLMKEVVKILLDGLGLRLLLSSETGYRYISTEISLPYNSGRNEIVNECFRILGTFPPKDYALEIISIIISNNNGKILELWENEVYDKTDNALVNWLFYGLNLRVLHKIENSKLLRFFEDKQNLTKKVAILIQAGKGVFIESMPEIAEKISENILNGNSERITVTHPDSFLSTYWRLFDPYFFMTVVGNTDNISCLSMLNRRFQHGSDFQGELHVPNSTFLGNKRTNKYYNYLKFVYRELDKPAKQWNSEFGPWEMILEQGRKIFGERILFFNISVIGASIKVSVDDISENDSLFDSSISLIKRVRYARLRSKNITWWKSQYNNITIDDDRYLYIITLMTWASTSVITKIMELVKECLSIMSDEYFNILYLNLKKMCKINGQNRHYKNYSVSNLNNDTEGVKLKKILAIKLQGKNLMEFKNKFLKDFKGKDVDLYEILQDMTLENVFNNNEVEINLEIIRKCYSRGVLNDKNIFEYNFFRHYSRDISMNIKHAKLVLKNPSAYPRIIIRLAESSLKENLSKNVKSVKEISLNEEWF